MDILTALRSYNVHLRKHRHDPQVGATLEIHEDGVCWLNDHSLDKYDFEGTNLVEFASPEEAIAFLTSFSSANDIRIHEMYDKAA